MAFKEYNLETIQATSIALHSMNLCTIGKMVRTKKRVIIFLHISGGQLRLILNFLNLQANPVYRSYRV